MGLFGCGSVQGRVFLDGTPLIVRSPLEAISHKLAMITNDRKTTGVVLPMSVIENTVMAADRSGWRNPTSERDRTASAATALQLRAASLDMEVGELSGGNQQKVVLAKWMLTEPSVLLLDEPTRGVDVGAKREIYQWILEWARKGATILLISTELPELLALSDRIMVLHRGEVVRILDRSEATPERVIAAAMGDAA
jgi:ABC-type sugar transport system ATPase subunit